jgi:hypothetical protein
MAPRGRDEQTEHFWDNRGQASGHGRPGPAGYTSSRRTPAGDSGVRHAHAVSYAQSQAGGRRQDAPSLAEPRCGSAGNPKDPIRNLTCTILKKCYAPCAVAVSPTSGTVFVTGYSVQPSTGGDYATVAYSG